MTTEFMACREALEDCHSEIKLLRAESSRLMGWHGNLQEENAALSKENGRLKARLTTMAQQNKEALVNVPKTNPTDQENG